jgi:hypothetical protein
MVTHLSSVISSIEKRGDLFWQIPREPRFDRSSREWPIIPHQRRDDMAEARVGNRIAWVTFAPIPKIGALLEVWLIRKARLDAMTTTLYFYGYNAWISR